HSINPVAGSATTLIEIAISGLEGQGIDAADPLELAVPPVNDPLGESGSITLQTFIGGDYSSPPKPDSGVSAVFSDYDWTNEYPTAYSADPNVVMYGKSVEIHTPEIGASDVDDRAQQILQTVVVDVPIDEYSLVYSGAC
ncbi:MAG: hypothetical protein GY942_13195, partial [Aestuariibacter sp.]|nr:hypothetical protein [Aestuariibacter sp.]